ncbi:MAG: deoxyribodipyrimidine photolyase [Gammaproteobacteria bacterium]|nr:deoxyribodipyrimidine photolyase [Gammaproteobacteria bacterium]
MREPVADRLAGLERLRDFLPRMGRRYEAERNIDRGSGQHHAVSTLSPWIRRRLLTEAEVVDAAITAHGAEAAAKFIEEVFWRGYFKGWLEQRPQVWTRYRDGLSADLAALERDPVLRAAVARAEAGETGIACFDAWARELVETGYLHNHARMWFASIWVFTLRLPWRIGADLFLRHLLDGDPASNTLGWRWVAGLHTRGKAYRARAGNIATCTGGRFTPREDELDGGEEGLEASEPDGLPPLMPLRAVTAPRPGIPSALLITEEDCRLEDFPLSTLDLRAVAVLSASQLRSPRPVAPAVCRFEQSALTDAVARIAPALSRAGSTLHAERIVIDRPETLARWAAAKGLRQIVTPYIPRGPLHDRLVEASPHLAAADITFAEWRRGWDEAVWPHATAGFFKVKERIPRLLASTVRR